MASPNSAIMQSIEKLNYRVTVGDVATQSGLDVQFVQKELLQLANDTNGHLQVAETGDIAYLFSSNFRSILRNKYWQLRWQQGLQKAWNIVFYLIKISFGIILITLIILLVITIFAIMSKKNSDNEDSGESLGGGSLFFLPRFWISPDFFWMFSPNYEERRYQRQRSNQRENELNFLESIYSFLFGDGNPNRNLEEKRWQEIAAVIKNNNGAIIAEQVAPYLDNINIYNERDEDYILPVLTRFNGYPEVSEKGEIIYYFPELQITAEERNKAYVSPYLKENLWQFSVASSGQKIGAIALGGICFILSLVVGVSISFSNILFLVAFVYSGSYLTIPLIRYFWLQNRNRKVESRNNQRENRANMLKSNRELQNKIDYAQQFAQQKVITGENLAYSTEKDLLDQEIEYLE